MLRIKDVFFGFIALIRNIGIGNSFDGKLRSKKDYSFKNNRYM